MVQIDGYWLTNGEKSVFRKRNMRFTKSQLKTFRRRVHLYFGSEIIFVMRSIPSVIDCKLVREFDRNPDGVFLLGEKHGVPEWYVRSLVGEYKRTGRVSYV